MNYKETLSDIRYSD